MIDRDYRVQLWNSKREVGTQGLAREAALGRSIFDVMTRQNAALMRQEFDEVLEQVTRWGLDDFLKDRSFDALSYPASR